VRCLPQDVDIKVFDGSSSHCGGLSSSNNHGNNTNINIVSFVISGYY
jgi:hypothetical protein